MTVDVKAAEPETTIEELACMMRDEDVGASPVLEDGRLLGIVTDRDIVVRCVAEGGDPGEMTAEDIISENVGTIDPETDIEEAARLMAERQIRRLPVIEEELVGMISLGDRQSMGTNASAALRWITSEGVKPVVQTPRRSRRPSLRDDAAAPWRRRGRGSRTRLRSASSGGRI